MVELCEVVGGPALSSFAVQDKVQAAELDPTMIVEEDAIFEEPIGDTCLFCGLADEVGIMWCDGCDKAIHVFCAGYDDAPEAWYCETCFDGIEEGLELPGLASAVRRGRGRRRPTRRSRPNEDRAWARVWQEISTRLDLDLDFPFDDGEDQRTPEQRREFARWQRRFEVGDQQGATNRLRDIANARLQPQGQTTPAAPESQDELRAWNAFDKARESQEAPSSIRRRKRKATASPAPSGEAEINERPPQKRPRLRRPHASDDSPPAQTSGSRAHHRQSNDQPTFLSSLLREVESNPISASSPDQHNSPLSPQDSSPDASSSGSATPRALSVSPAPQRPLSPPLSSTILPLSSPLTATFSPFSPTHLSHRPGQINPLHHRGRRRSNTPSNTDDDEAPRDRASSASPSRGLSYSAKQEIQRMVKLALGSRYRDKEITKDQYTDINKTVSRKLYDLVGDASALAGQAEREKWQDRADDEVHKAVAALVTATNGDE